MSTITTKDNTQIYYKDWGAGPVITRHPSLFRAPLDHVNCPLHGFDADAAPLAR
jgi:hypothetical protein